jgi:hypothetical protein
MKVAYLILAHNTANHLSRLVQALDSSNAAFFIHVDRKVDISCFRKALPQRNVSFLEKRVPVYWGEFSIVQATINLIREALIRPPYPQYLCLLSGSDYPLRSPKYIESFFSRYRDEGRQFINLVQMPCEALGKPLSRLHGYWIQTPCNNPLVMRAVSRLNRMLNDRYRLERDYHRVLRGLLPYGGSQWWALTEAACRYILSFVEARPDVVKFYRNTYIPDESFFHTIIGNSKFGERTARNLTFADWSNNALVPISMEHLHSFVGADGLMGECAYGRGELLFARKFSDDSSTLTDFIDTYIIKS